jgi:hypothetical protein
VRKNKYIIKDEVAYRKAADGTMTIVSPVTDKIITINTSATEVWEMIDGKLNMDEIKEQFISKHKDDADFPGETQAEHDIDVILEEFFKRELIEEIK